ncbi:menin [Periplaneta americana]|uniref:menin n=1 Tax=Periplaneta americana TaxID=6978 RepID=UPI0037E7B830
MAGFREVDRQHFPLEDIPSIVRLFKQQLESSSEPDLALLSIVVGAVENSLTCNRTFTLQKETDTLGEPKLPAVEYHIAEALYSKFHAIIKGAVDLTQYSGSKYATRELVKKVSDVVWNSLTRSYYKDRAHLQSLYSYLTGNKLDCFGVAFAVVAGCQVLGYRDVHLALSEDHAWVVFGEGGSETAEVTWHGKGNEDKRGQPVGPGMGSRSWLYVNGCPVICTRPMEVAALVSAINPSLSATSDAMEVALLQQELLWLLYDLGHLTHYPMAIGNLSDLEEVSPTPGRPPCSTLFQEAAISARTYYKNQHVYPYTYQGGYFYRHKMYKEAFESWANAADVIRLYNYSRDDEEIYKEFLEIANELIPHIMKVVSSGHSARSILKDPECFAHLLRFYDGICQWEEGSLTPVLHIGWAKPLVNTISKFDADVRAQVMIECRGSESSDGGEGANADMQTDGKNNLESKELLLTLLKEETPAADEDTACNKGTGADPKYLNNEYLNNNNYCKTREGGSNNTRDIIRTLESRVIGDDVGKQKLQGDEEALAPHPSIAALTAACGEKILNPEYLLQGGGEPFVGGGSVIAETPTTIPSLTSNGAHAPGPSKQDDSKEQIESELKSTGRPRLVLRSHKMKGLKDLLLAEKLNTHAISLQLTAQSQVQVSKKGRGGPEPDMAAMGLRAKRARRD